jgi:hypothetical protein
MEDFFQQHLTVTIALRYFWLVTFWRKALMDERYPSVMKLAILQKQVCLWLTSGWSDYLMSKCSELAKSG